MNPASPILVLATGGVPDVDLRLPANAAPAVEYAAEEFRRHLCRIAGATSCVRSGRTKIYVGDNDAASTAGIDVAGLELGPEAFHVEARAGSLFIIGGGARGVLYGMYEVLERLGCRWFSPETERIPRQADIRLAWSSETHRPAFENRDNFNWETADPVWRARNRLNGWKPVIPEYMGGHNDYGMWCHTFFELVSPNEFFAQHPEYFTMVGGVRRRDGNQLCLSNPAVRRLLTQRLLARIQANPKATIFSVSQNDGLGYCECPACMAIAAAEGSQSGLILWFVNAVATEVAQKHPRVLIDTIAYLYSVDAPRQVRPVENVRVRLCAFGCCQAHGFGACDQSESQRFLKALNGWSRITSQLYIWHYCTNFASYLLPMPNFDEIRANIGLYHQRKVRGIFMQGQGDQGGGAELSALRGYVIGRLLWNPQQPVWPLVDEFLAAHYGKAAPAVRRYMNIFQQAVNGDQSLHFSLGEPHFSRLYEPRRVAAADRALAAGEAVATGRERLRVRLLRDGLGYIRLNRAVAGFRIVGNSYRNAAGPADRRLLKRLVADWQRAGIENLSEGSGLKHQLPMWRNRLSPHRIVRLRDAEMSIAIVPSLGGRLLELHAAGRQWLPTEPAGGGDYPCPQGYSEVAGYITGSLEPYAWRRQGAWLHLAATVGEGLKLSRWLRIQDGVLRIESRLWNPTKQMNNCSWGGGFQLQLAGLAAGRVTVAGKMETISAAQIPTDGTLAFERDRLPSQWEFDFDGGVVQHRFGGPALYRAALKRNANLSLYLCSNLLQLQPGDEILNWQELTIRKCHPHHESVRNGEAGNPS